jgi:hypothetical protein
MTAEEKEEYEELKSLLYTGQISQYGKRKLIDIIEKQDTEINKLNNVIDYMAGEIDTLNYELIGEWCKEDKGDKCKNCDHNDHDCIKEYFMKQEQN